jgi:hypothetical protein
MGARVVLKPAVTYAPVVLSLDHLESTHAYVFSIHIRAQYLEFFTAGSYGAAR